MLPEWMLLQQIKTFIKSSPEEQSFIKWLILLIGMAGVIYLVVKPIVDAVKPIIKSALHAAF